MTHVQYSGLGDVELGLTHPQTFQIDRYNTRRLNRLSAGVVFPSCLIPEMSLIYFISQREKYQKKMLEVIEALYVRMLAECGSDTNCRDNALGIKLRSQFDLSEEKLSLENRDVIHLFSLSAVTIISGICIAIMNRRLKERQVEDSLCLRVFTVLFGAGCAAAGLTNIAAGYVLPGLTSTAAGLFGIALGFAPQKVNHAVNQLTTKVSNCFKSIWRRSTVST